MSEIKNVIGETHGRVLITRLMPGIRRSGKTYKQVWGKCSCGMEQQFDYHALKFGHKKSCGCLWLEKTSVIWKNLRNRYKMINRRCYDSNSKDYKNYGARGIAMCSEWKNSFYEFYKWCTANGFSIELEFERKDNDGDYCPDNIVFATKTVNNRNMRRTVMSWDIVNSIRVGEYRWLSCQAIALILNCSPSTVDAVRRFQTWKTID